MHLNVVNVVSSQLKWIFSIYTSAFWSTHSNVPTKATFKFVIKAAALQICPCKFVGAFEFLVLLLNGDGLWNFDFFQQKKIFQT